MQIALDMVECCNAASHCCHPLTISAPMGNQMWPTCHARLFCPWWTADKWTTIADTDTEILPTCVASLELLKGHLEIGVETQTVPHLCLGRIEETLVSFPSGWCSALSPGGNDIMRLSMSTLCLISIVNAAHTLHFGPVMAALWAALKIWQSIMSAQSAPSVSWWAPTLPAICAALLVINTYKWKCRRVQKMALIMELLAGMCGQIYILDWLPHLYSLQLHWWEGLNTAMHRIH